MTSTEHLDTLKLLLSENLAVLDRHTAQFKQLQDSVKQLFALVNQQAQAIDLLLLHHAGIQADSAEMKSQQADISLKLDRIRELL